MLARRDALGHPDRAVPGRPAGLGRPAIAAPKADRCALTLCIQGGKKDKLRPGDLLGALTGDGGLTFEQVGKINVTEFNTYVALDRRIAKQAFSRLSNSAIKGKRFRMRYLEEL